MQEMQETCVQSLGQEDFLEEAWQPTPVFLPGESLRQRSLKTTVHGVLRVRHNLATKPPPPTMKMIHLLGNIKNYFFLI